MVRSIDRRVNIQLIGQGTRRPDTFFLLRHADDHAIRVGINVGGVFPASSDFGGRKSSVFGRWKLPCPLFGFAKLKTDVRSPTTARRHGEILGSNTPKRFSMNWITDE